MLDIQINKLRYIPKYQRRITRKKKDSKTEETKEEWIPEKWLAYSNDTKKESEVTYDYLASNFELGFLERVKRSGSSTNAFTDIPPGDFKLHVEYPKDISKGPKLHYRQLKDARTCLTTSFANVLWSCNCKVHAGDIYKAHKLCLSPKALPTFKAKLMELSSKLKCTNIKITMEELQTKLYLKPVVTCVKGSDGKQDHTIAIFRGLIYDGNFTHAIPLSQNALDHCCSSDSAKCKFVEFVKSFYFPYFEKYVLEFEQVPDKKK